MHPFCGRSTSSSLHPRDIRRLATVVASPLYPSNPVVIVVLSLVIAGLGILLLRHSQHVLSHSFPILTLDVSHSPPIPTPPSSSSHACQTRVVRHPPPSPSNPVVIVVLSLVIAGLAILLMCILDTTLTFSPHSNSQRTLSRILSPF